MRRVRTVSVVPVGPGWQISGGRELENVCFADLGTAIDAAGALCEDGPVRIVVLDRASPVIQAAAA